MANIALKARLQVNVRFNNVIGYPCDYVVNQSRCWGNNSKLCPLI
ncbi:hypothetical protein VCR14J2_410572 [Vibrio coralliirubri]|nr:hypothetical protein VCR14J2_410572 [Vibrio coralliirubri]